MRVKKFEAKTMKDALQMVKNELGPDAVILAAKDNSQRYGLQGRSSVEITAAVSESTLQKKNFVESRMTKQTREKFQQSDAKTQRRIISQMVEKKLQESEADTRRKITPVSYIDIQDEVVEMGGPHRRAAYERARGRNVDELLNDFEQDFEEDKWSERSTREVAKTRPSVRGAYAQESVSRGRPVSAGAYRSRNESLAAANSTSDARSGNAVRPEGRRSAEPARPETTRESLLGSPTLENQTNRPASTQSNSMERDPRETRDREITSLKSEIERLQKVLDSFQRVPQTFATMHPGADYGIPYDLSFMFQKLLDAGITIDNAVDLLQVAAKEIEPAQLKKRSVVDAWVARWLLDHTSVVSDPWQGRVHLFVGGAGSGKTSSLVKMASRLVVKEKKRIAILSTDAFKVGAVDQLKIYCQILNVPFAVIRNKKDWEWVIGQLKYVDHILVDFPGLQLKTIEEIQMLKSIMPPEELHPVCHFCISATAKDGDAYELAKRYRLADYQDLIFTNLDQSVQHGLIYNLQKKVGKPIHSFGIGNKIPEDFELGSKERVLDLIFKLTKLKREMK